MAIEGMQDILLTIRFRMPPDIPPEVAASMIAKNGVCVSTGLMAYAKEMDCRVVPFKKVD